jgi:hypothetical protein
VEALRTGLEKAPPEVEAVGVVHQIAAVALRDPLPDGVSVNEIIGVEEHDVDRAAVEPLPEPCADRPPLPRFVAAGILRIRGSGNGTGRVCTLAAAALARSPSS